MGSIYGRIEQLWIAGIYSRAILARIVVLILCQTNIKFTGLVLSGPNWSLEICMALRVSNRGFGGVIVWLKSWRYRFLRKWLWRLPKTNTFNGWPFLKVVALSLYRNVNGINCCHPWRREIQWWGALSPIAKQKLFLVDISTGDCTHALSRKIRMSIYKDII